MAECGSSSVALGTEVLLRDCDHVVKEHKIAVRIEGERSYRASSELAAGAPEFQNQIKARYEHLFAGGSTLMGNVPRDLAGAGQGAAGEKAGPPAAADVEDARTLWLDYDSRGRRYKDWRLVTEECE